MSTALADLEKAFQVQLLVRHHARGISLTPAGRELLVASRQLLTQAADLLGAAEGLGSSLTGTVQIGCFSVPALYVLPDLLATAAVGLGSAVRRLAGAVIAGHPGERPRDTARLRCFAALCPALRLAVFIIVGHPGRI